MYVEADARGRNEMMSENIPTYKITLAGSPNSCVIKIGKTKFKSPVDTGAEVSFMHHRVYDSLLVKPKLQFKRINLSGVSGGALKIDGCMNLIFSIGVLKCNICSMWLKT